jgi:HAD superfamily hydrolase (TIGR01509 family)
MDKQFAIFDMDGTLIDSMIFWKNLASEYLRSKGVQSIPTDLLERIKPMTMSESAALFRQEFRLAGDPEAEMNAMMDAHYRNDIPLKPGVREYLQMLHSRGVRMCVASATAEHLMETCLTRLGVRDCFEFLLSCETVGAGKRSPLVYHESAGRLHAAAAEIAVYEDALYAVQTAKEAGYYVVGVYDDSAAKNWLTIEKLADEIVLNWEEAV